MLNPMVYTKQSQTAEFRRAAGAETWEVTFNDTINWDTITIALIKCVTYELVCLYVTYVTFELVLEDKSCTRLHGQPSRQNLKAALIN